MGMQNTKDSCVAQSNKAMRHPQKKSRLSSTEHIHFVASVATACHSSVSGLKMYQSTA